MTVLKADMVPRRWAILWPGLTASAAVSAAAYYSYHTAGNNLAVLGAPSTPGTPLLSHFVPLDAGEDFMAHSAAGCCHEYPALNQQSDILVIVTSLWVASLLQVKSWPTQPLDVAISWLKDKPSEYVVVDYGCGEARLAATVKQVTADSK